jgi:transposase
MATELAEERETLRHLMRTDPDPRVRHRAHALLLLGEGQTVAAVARLFATAGHRVRAWRERFLAEGRLGLMDRSRRGRPPKLSETDRAFLAQALEQGPQPYGLPVTVWSIRDLQALVQRERGMAVSVDTLHRAVQALGYRYRRPRHDLRHRQDAEAVAAAKRVLDWLQKKAYLQPDDPLLQDPIWSTWTSARSTLIPIWQRSGDARDSR